MIARNTLLSCYKVFVLIITYVIVIYLWIKISLVIYLTGELIFNSDE